MFDNIRVFVFDQGLMNQPDEVTSVRTLSKQEVSAWTAASLTCKTIKKHIKVGACSTIYLFRVILEV